MLFSSTIFLFAFLPGILLGYYLAPKKLRNLFLLAASTIFYAWGIPKALLVMFFSIFVNYSLGLAIAKFTNIKLRKVLILVGIISNLAILGYFKYYGFFIENLNQLFNASYPVISLALPLGISFYTFQALSYIIDVYRKKVKVQKNLVNLALYIALFPQLVAGPIVRYKEISKEIVSRKETLNKFTIGTERFIIGLSKKMILANNFGVIANSIFDAPPDNLAMFSSWIGVLAYTLQIYFDFSGYSDMAIGLGRMFGFKFPENFDYPYISKSIIEFWRRWHITLSMWFRDYLYIPLGGNRVSTARFIFNLFIVWFATGFWHGSSWIFIAWGLYFFVLIVFEKYVYTKLTKYIPIALQHFYALLAIMIGWVLFRSESFEFAFQLLRKLFLIGEVNSFDNMSLLLLDQNKALLLLGIVMATPLVSKLDVLISKTNRYRIGEIYKILVRPMLFFSLLIISTALVVSSTFNPFIYFRF